MSDEQAEEMTKPAEEEEEEEDEEDLEKLQAEIARMEAEAARITKETEELEKKKDAKIAAAGGGVSAKASSGGDTPSRDGHSVYVGQVDYMATPEELLSHFEACGTVERVTIVCDKYSGKPKGTYLLGDCSYKNDYLHVWMPHAWWLSWHAQSHTNCFAVFLGFAYLEFNVGYEEAYMQSCCIERMDECRHA
jgi:hypothetical protein